MIESIQLISDHIKLFSGFTQGTINFSGSISQYPVERGVNFADHFQKKPTQFSVNGHINKFANSRPNDLLDTVERIFNERIIISVNTEAKLYENIVITSFKADKSGETGHGYNFSINLTQVYVTDLATSVNQGIQASERADETDQGRQN